MKLLCDKNYWFSKICLKKLSNFFLTFKNGVHADVQSQIIYSIGDYSLSQNKLLPASKINHGLFVKKMVVVKI